MGRDYCWVYRCHDNSYNDDNYVPRGKRQPCLVDENEWYFEDIRTRLSKYRDIVIALVLHDRGNTVCIKDDYGDEYTADQLMVQIKGHLASLIDLDAE